MTNSDTSKSINVNLLTSILAITVLYIHHQVYALEFVKYWGYANVNTLNFYLRVMAVGGFIFLSGYKLSQSKTSEPVARFIKKRFLRLAPLYILSLVFFAIYLYSFYVGVKPTFMNIVVHIFGMQAIFFEHYGGEFPILYFVGLLYLYYMVFIVLRGFFYDKMIFFILSITLFFILISLRIFLYHNTGLVYFSNLFFFYYSSFISGMLYESIDKWLSQKNSLVVSFCLVVVSIISSLFYVSIVSIEPIPWYLFVRENIFYVFMSIPLFVFFIRLKIVIINKPIIDFINKLAYSSFAVYLFHAPIWKIMSWFWNESGIYHFLYIFLFGFLVIFVVSYYIQSFYDKILKRIEK